MKEVKGEYGTAKIFTDLVEEKAIEQVKQLMDQEFVKDCKVRMMPDIHAGSGCVIGTTMEIKNKICPNLVGVDIGCGMLCVLLKDKDIDLEKLDRVISEHIPSGFEIRKKEVFNTAFLDINKLNCKDSVDLERAYLSLGTLGSGNHFIEVDKDDEDNLYLVIHTGSRHLGVEVANFYQEQGYNKQIYLWKKERDLLIKSLKANGREKDIESELSKLKFGIPKDLAYVSGPLFNDYLHDMKIVQHYAYWNRLTIADHIMAYMGWRYRGEDGTNYFTTVHNYIDTDSMILRKGAVSAKAGETLLIPMNMRDGSLICRGKGNPDWNYSAPHGAGRLMSRTEAKKNIDISEFEESMEGIYTTSVSEDTLDECPMAYKPMESIIENIGDTVDILKVIKPIYNFKAGETKK